MSVAGLIQKHQASVLPHDDTDSCQLRVRRKHLLEDTLCKFRSGLALDKPLRVTFLGEPGVDEGAGFQSYFCTELALHFKCFPGNYLGLRISTLLFHYLQEGQGENSFT